MKHQSKFTSGEQAQASEQQTQREAPREFANVEEMLRHDALHTPVPPSIAHRLQSSIGPATPAPSWWKRLLGPFNQ